MIKSSAILFVLFYLVSAHSQQTIDKLNSNQLKLPKETISKALSIDANGQVKSSGTSDVELGYLSGTSSNVQGQINDKANDSDAVHLTGDESISGVKTLTGKLVTSSTVNASIPCPVMTQTQRDAIATPVTGDCVFNSNTSLSNIYDGSIWKAMGGSGGGIGLWVTANGYAVDDVVIESNNIYICLTAHTSGTFATDLASLYWLRLSTDVTGATGLLPLATGGTNKSITASNGSIIYSDSDSLELLSPGTSGQILQTNGAAAPTFVNKSISGKAQNKSSVISEEIQFPNNLLTETGTNKYLSESGNKNILDNPSFEHSTFSTSWTNSAGTFTQELTSVIDGKASAKLVLSSQSFSLSQSSTLYAAQFADGVQGLAMVRIKSGIALKVCSIQAGTVSSTNCVTTNTDSKWGLYKVPFILGATSNGISISSNGTLVSGTVFIDDAFVGAQDLTQNITACQTADCLTSFTVIVSSVGAVVSESSDWVTTCTNVSGTVACTFTSDLASSLTIGMACTGNRIGSGGGTAAVLGDQTTTTGFSATSGTTTSNLSVYTCTKQGADYTAAINRSNGNTYSSTNADTDWASCGHTPSDFTGFGTVTGIETQCKRQGSDLLMRGKFTAVTSTAVEARVNLKLGGTTLTSASSSSIPSLQASGTFARSGVVSAGNGGMRVTLIEPSVTYFTFGFENPSFGGLSKMTGANLGSSVDFSFNVRIPIVNWQNSNVIIGSFNGLQSCTNTLACTDTFSARFDAAGSLQSENVDWVSGNASLSDTSLYTITLNSGVFVAGNPACTVSNISTSGTTTDTVKFNNTPSTTTIVVRTQQHTASFGKVAQPFQIICQKQGADYIGKTAMAVASDQNLRTPSVTKAVFYSSKISSTGVVSNEQGDFLSSCTNPSAGSYVCSFNTSTFASTPNCQANVNALISGGSQSASAYSESISSVSIHVLSGGAASSQAFNLSCHGVSP